MSISCFCWWDVSSHQNKLFMRKSYLEMLKWISYNSWRAFKTMWNDILTHWFYCIETWCWRNWGGVGYACCYTEPRKSTRNLWDCSSFVSLHIFPIWSHKWYVICRFSTLKDVITFLQGKLKPFTYEIQVLREDLLNDVIKATKRPSFDPMKKIEV